MTKDRARAKSAQYLVWAEANERKAEELHASFHQEFKDFDWTQPILRGHHSQRRHEKVFERRNSMYERIAEYEAKAKRMREKAENLLIFANTNKGDAEARREEKRADADKQFAVGASVTDVVYGAGVITRVNKKTFSIRWASGSAFARDKSYFS